MNIPVNTSPTQSSTTVPHISASPPHTSLSQTSTLPSSSQKLQSIIPYTHPVREKSTSPVAATTIRIQLSTTPLSTRTPITTTPIPHKTIFTPRPIIPTAMATTQVKQPKPQTPTTPSKLYITNDETDHTVEIKPVTDQHIADTTGRFGRGHSSSSCHQTIPFHNSMHFFLHH